MPLTWTIDPQLLALLAGACLVLLVFCLFVLLRRDRRQASAAAHMNALRHELLENAMDTREDILQDARDSRMETLQVMTSMIQSANERLDSFAQQNAAMIRASDQRLATFMQQNAEQLEGVRQTVHSRLTAIQEDNGKRLDQMRATVDEKLQKTLESRINESFRVVSERLEQVYKGLGEMQTLARGVGDLKKVLSNVKSRGILGEIQLGAILEDILSPDQYLCNYAPKPGSREAVEYAIRLPGDDDGPVYLPVDAKFPADPYTALQDAYDTGSSQAIEAAADDLRRALNQSARDIRQRYIAPPATTDFAILFLPFEGLYAEVVRRGLLETLQRDYKVVVAGPSTMAALLNSLQMGFKTLAIQKRSSEVWAILGAVKTEFDKFDQVLRATQQHLDQAHKDLDVLVGTRTRQIQRRLRAVTELPEADSAQLLSGMGLEESEE